MRGWRGNVLKDMARQSRVTLDLRVTNPRVCKHRGAVAFELLEE
jgi:hypothetical protein